MVHRLVLTDLSHKAARKTAKQDEARASLTKFHIELAKGKYDDPLLRVIKSKASGEAPEAALREVGGVAKNLGS